MSFPWTVTGLIIQMEINHFPDLTLSEKKEALENIYNRIVKNYYDCWLASVENAGTPFLNVTKTKLLEAQRLIRENIRNNTHPPIELFSAASIQSEALKLHYALDLLQTQGIESTRQFFRRMQQDAQLQSGTCWN